MSAKKISNHFERRLGELVASGACMCDGPSLDDAMGSGVVGGARRRRRRRGAGVVGAGTVGGARHPKFNIAKYNKAIRSGHSKTRAKEIARGGTMHHGAGLLY